MHMTFIARRHVCVLIYIGSMHLILFVYVVSAIIHVVPPFLSRNFPRKKDLQPDTRN